MPLSTLVTNFLEYAKETLFHAPYLIAALIGLGFLIGFHELGHFLFCKFFGVATPSFSIGFGPKLFSKKINGTDFSLSAIPLGGYVEIAGMQEVAQGEQLQAKHDGSSSFTSKPYYQKMLILFGGILFNLIFAYTALVALFLLGIPKTPLLFPLNSTTIIKKVTEDSPAAHAGLQPNDQIISLDTITFGNNLKPLIEALEQRANTTVTLSINRAGENISIPVTLGERKAGSRTVGTLGVEFDIEEIPATSFSKAITGAAKTTYELSINTANFLKSMFQKKTVQGLGGPVMIIAQTAAGAAKGISIYVLFLVIISINLAVLNLLPLPILDGGQALFYTIEALIGRSISDTIRYGIHLATWVLLMGLILYLTFKDTISIFFTR